MGIRAVYFALTPAQHAELLALPEDESRVEYVEEVIEEAWDEKHLQEVDSAWDAIHRCLTGRQNAEPGQLDNSAGSYPLNQCVLGGRAIYFEPDYVLRLIEPTAVRDLAAAVQQIDKDAFRERYFQYCKDAWPEFGEEDFEYTWEWFSALREFLTRMVPTGRSILFTAAQ